MRTFLFLSAMLISALIVGCATTQSDVAKSLSQAKSPAWSMDAVPDEMIVSVCPIGKSIRLVGSTGLVLGAGADWVVNEQYRGPIRAALKGYDASAVFEDCIRQRLTATIGEKLSEVQALGTTAGVSSLTEAENQRFAKLSKKGTDVVLDLYTTFGIYGPEATLATRISGKVTVTSTGKRLWADEIIVNPEPVLANATLGDFTNRLGTSITNIDFTVDGEKVRRWYADGGSVLKRQFELGANDAAAALICDLGLAEDGVGEYALGKSAMSERHFKEAAAHFKRALELDPGIIDAQNAFAVNLAFNDQLDDAIKLENALVQSNPDFGPAWFNLAWWYAVEKKDPKSAAPCYEKARALGMPVTHAIEKRLGTK